MRYYRRGDLIVDVSAAGTQTAADARYGGAVSITNQDMAGGEVVKRNQQPEDVRSPSGEQVKETRYEASNIRAEFANKVPGIPNSHGASVVG